MGYTEKEREEYNQTRKKICKALIITKNEYNWLRRYGQALRKLYTGDCNGVITNSENYDNIVNTIYARVDTYAKKLGLFIYYQTDPRGATIYADRKPIPENSYNNAHCIF